MFYTRMCLSIWWQLVASFTVFLIKTRDDTFHSQGLQGKQLHIGHTIYRITGIGELA